MLEEPDEFLSSEEPDDSLRSEPVAEYTCSTLSSPINAATEASLSDSLMLQPRSGKLGDLDKPKEPPRLISELVISLSWLTRSEPDVLLCVKFRCPEAPGEDIDDMVVEPEDITGGVNMRPKATSCCGMSPDDGDEAGLMASAALCDIPHVLFACVWIPL